MLLVQATSQGDRLPVGDLGSCSLLLPGLGLHRVPWQHQFLNHDVCWTLWVKAVFLKEKKKSCQDKDLSPGKNNARDSFRAVERGGGRWQSQHC